MYLNGETSDKNMVQLLIAKKIGQRSTTPWTNVTSSHITTKKQCPSWPTGREVMTTSSCWVRGYNSTPSPTVQSTPVNRTVERDSAVSGY